MGVRVRVTGSTSNTAYVNQTKTYTNTSFGFTTETVVFFVPANATDNNLIVSFAAFNNSTTLGVIVDDIQLILLGSLPVKWESFTGNNVNNSVVLNWTTAAEINNDYFVIERANGSNQFDSIGRVNSSSSRTYRFVDQKPGKNVNIYRIRQVDIDGNAQYSKVITVTNSTEVSNMKLFPTQARSTVTLQLNSNNNPEFSILVTDVNGRIIKQIGQFRQTQQTIDVTGLQAGVYYVVVRSADLSINQTKAFHKVD